jgi:hypothetical protein
MSDILFFVWHSNWCRKPYIGEIKMDKMLLVVGRNLTDMGYIDEELLTWGEIKKKFSPRYKFAIFGMKEKKFMVLPCIDFNNILYKEVRYYSKEEVSLKYLGFKGVLAITPLGGGEAMEYYERSGGSETKLLITMFNYGP